MKISEEKKRYRSAIIERSKDKLEFTEDSLSVRLLKEFQLQEYHLWLKPFLRYLQQYENNEIDKIRADKIKGVVFDLLRNSDDVPSLVVLAQSLQLISELFRIEEPWLNEQVTRHNIEEISFQDLERYEGIEIDIVNKQIIVDINDQKKHSILIPPLGAGIKGGNARIILHKMFGDSTESLESEIPPSDIDYIVFDPKLIYQFSEDVVKDIRNVTFDNISSPEKTLSKQDITHNACLILNDRFLFTDKAKEAVISSTVTSNIRSRSGFYGQYYHLSEGEIVPTSKQLFRMMKLVAEKRAKSVMVPENLNEGLNEYWLVVVNRYFNREDFYEIMQRYFLLEKELGFATGDDFIDEVQKQLDQHPYYIIGELPDDIEFYLLSKLVEHIEHYLSQTQLNSLQASIPEYKKVELPDDYSLDKSKLVKKWENFLTTHVNLI